MILKYRSLLATALAFSRGTNAFSFSGAVVHSRTNSNESEYSPFTQHGAVLQSLTFARTTPAYRVGGRSETIVLLAKKSGSKKRRRKDGGGGGKTKKNIPQGAVEERQVQDIDQDISLGDDGELPGFDLVEDIDLPTVASLTGGRQLQTATSTASLSVDLNDPDAVLEAMKPKNAILPASSTRDLLRSRNLDLEKRFVVDEITLEVPTLAEYTKNSRSSTSSPGPQTTTKGGGGRGQVVGKKAARAAARKDAAIEAEEAENSGLVNMLSKLPTIPRLPFTPKLRDEDTGDLNPIKIIENAAWAGIYTLVIWEIYINSPLFTRALPMAPVVFSDPATML